MWEAVCRDSWVWRRSGRRSGEVREVGRPYVGIPGFGAGLGGGQGDESGRPYVAIPGSGGGLGGGSRATKRSGAELKRSEL